MEGKIQEYVVGNPDLAVVPPGKCQLTPNWTSLQLKKKQRISPDTIVFTFYTPDRSKPLNLSTCACILARTHNAAGEEIVRPYTPCSTNSRIGEFDVMIKIYPDGRMTQNIVKLKAGDSMDFKHIEFNVKIQYPFKKKFVGMIVGGSGVTPMIQALHALLGNKSDDTEICMLYGSRSSENILAKSLLDKWSADHTRFEVTHFLSQEPEDSGWDGERGRISKEAIEQAFPKPSDEMIIFVCGPTPMYETFSGPRDKRDEVTGVLADLGYSPSQVYKF